MTPVPETGRSAAWVARIPLADAAALGVLRDVPGLRLGTTATHGWIRGNKDSDPISESLANRLRQELGAEIFHLINDGLCVPWGKRVPTAALPHVDWHPLRESCVPSIPVARFGPPRPEPLRLELKPSDAVVAPTFLLCSLDCWRDYVQTAPSLRLARWVFAASEQGDVLIRGTPLPPLPGRHYWETGRLVIPCGWTWSPALSSDVVRAVLQLEGDAWALADDVTSQWTIIPEEAFVAARRQNVQGTWEQLKCGEVSPT